MPDILVVKDSSTQIAKLGITSAERLMWMESYQTIDGANPKFASDASSVLRHFNCGTVSNAAGYTGTVRAYYG